MEEGFLMDDDIAGRGLYLTTNAKSHLKTTGIWAVVMSVIGFLLSLSIIIGGISIVVVSLNLGTIDNLPQDDLVGGLGGLGFILVFIGLAFLVPSIYLLLFAMSSFKSESSMDAFLLEKCLGRLKNSLMAICVVSFLSFIAYFGWIMYIGMSSVRNF